jgi:hypothetical protein
LHLRAIEGEVARRWHRQVKGGETASLIEPSRFLD